MTYFVERVVPDFLPMEKAYGIYVTFNALSREQRSLGDRVEIHYRSWRPALRKGKTLVREIDGLRCFEHAVPRPASLCFPAQLVDRLSRSDSDVVHVHTRCALSIGPLGLRKPHVIHLHGMPYYATEKGLGTSRYDLMAYMHMRAFLRYADLVICYCRSLRRRVIDLFNLPPSRVVTVFNGFDPRLLARDGFDIREAYGIGDRPIALFVGRAQPIKGTVEFVKACKLATKKVPDLAPVVIGSGWDELLRNLGESEKFVTLPHISHKCMGSAYAASNLHVAITKTFGYQKTTVEAAACGTPVLVTDNVDNRSILGSVGTYVNPFSVEEIANGMVRTILSPPARQELLKVSRAVRRTFTWNNAANAIQAIYDHMCN